MPQALRCAILCSNWRCVTPKANAPPRILSAVLSAITQRQSAQVGKPAQTAGSPTYT
ncbi:hypothetical protein [Nostoc sp.]|uniref:hypothetical protein n=1 Tax=Nostoc sp. TaxID=1180 RepID=UPI002FF72B93